MNAAIETLKGLQAFPVNAAILARSGKIVAVNDGWKTFARQNELRLPNFGIGANYLKFCETGEQPSRFATELRELLAGRQKLLTFIYPCHSRTRKRWFSLIALPLSLHKPAGAALLHINLTDALRRERRVAPMSRVWQTRPLKTRGTRTLSAT